MTESGKLGRQPRLDIVAVTISPPPNNSLVKCLKRWIKRLGRLKSRFMFYPEIAYNEKTNTNRLHFHGVITCLDMVQFQKDIEVLKSYCYIDVKKIYSMSKWISYCKKELVKTKISLGFKKNSNIVLNNETCKIETESYDIIDHYIKVMKKESDRPESKQI